MAPVGLGPSLAQVHTLTADARYRVFKIGKSMDGRAEANRQPRTASPRTHPSSRRFVTGTQITLYILRDVRGVTSDNGPYVGFPSHSWKLGDERSWAVSAKPSWLIVSARQRFVVD